MSYISDICFYDFLFEIDSDLRMNRYSVLNIFDLYEIIENYNTKNYKHILNNLNFIQDRFGLKFKYEFDIETSFKFHRKSEIYDIINKLYSDESLNKKIEKIEKSINELESKNDFISSDKLEFFRKYRNNINKYQKGILFYEDIRKLYRTFQVDTYQYIYKGIKILSPYIQKNLYKEQDGFFVIRPFLTDENFYSIYVWGHGMLIEVDNENNLVRVCDTLNYINSGGDEAQNIVQSYIKDVFGEDKEIRYVDYDFKDVTIEKKSLIIDILNNKINELSSKITSTYSDNDAENEKNNNTLKKLKDNLYKVEKASTLNDFSKVYYNLGPNYCPDEPYRILSRQACNAGCMETAIYLSYLHKIKNINSKSKNINTNEEFEKNFKNFIDVMNLKKKGDGVFDENIYKDIHDIIISANNQYYNLIEKKCF